MTPETLRETLDGHAQWLRGGGGARADLTDADLTDAVLTGTDLRGAVLTRADLAGALLPEGVRYASVSWSGHGERGRRLHAVAAGTDAPQLSCGCFSGSPERLRAYIADGEEQHRASRTRALEIVLELLAWGGDA